MLIPTLAILAEATSPDGLGAPPADHNQLLVGVAVFLGLVLCLVATLAFNKDR